MKILFGTALAYSERRLTGRWSRPRAAVPVACAPAADESLAVVLLPTVVGGETARRIHGVYSVRAERLALADNRSGKRLK
jgi:hypothetical protein